MGVGPAVMRFRLLHGPKAPESLPQVVRLSLLTLLVTGLLMALTVANPPHAHAHNDLVSSVPADGGTVASLPTTASLVFSEPLGTTGLQVAITDGVGTPVAGLAASGVADATLTQELPTSMTPGRYTLAYRVVSVDGHPVGGTITFTVDAAAAPTTSPASPSATASTATRGTPTASTAPTAGTPPMTSQATAATGSDNGVHWWWLVIAVAVVLGLGLTLARRRRRGHAAADRSQGDTS